MSGNKRGRPRTSQDIVDLVLFLRIELYQQGLQFGAKAIRSFLDALGVQELPSVSTIGNILRINGATQYRKN